MSSLLYLAFDKNVQSIKGSGTISVFYSEETRIYYFYTIIKAFAEYKNIYCNNKLLSNRSCFGHEGLWIIFGARMISSCPSESWRHACCQNRGSIACSFWFWSYLMLIALTNIKIVCWLPHHIKDIASLGQQYFIILYCERLQIITNNYQIIYIARSSR